MTIAALTGPFLDPPTHLVAEYPVVPLIMGAVIAAASLVFGVIYTKRTGSPLYFWGAVSGLLLYPFLVEAGGDWFLAMWYPTNLDIAATSFGRPVPWFVILFYLGFVPFVAVAGYEIAKRGMPGKRLVQLVVVVAIIELPMEILGGHFGWMNYYGNHATLFEVPIYCYVQNAGMLAVVAWVLAWLLPHIHGWRWITVPFALALTLPAYAMVTTFPAYIAINAGAGPFWGWTAGIVSTILNAAAVLACIYSPTLRRLRESAQDNATVPEALPVR